MPTGNSPLKRITARRLIDGLGGKPLDYAAIIIEGSQIKQIGSQSKIMLPEGAEVIDFNYPDKTLLPGLVDAHTHHNFPGDGSMGEAVGLEPEDLLLMRSAHNARITLLSGVTTARDNGAKNKTTLWLKEGIRKGYITGPRMLVCGRPITITGGHMWYFGQEADGVDDLRKAVRHMVKDGADFIKIVVTGGSTLTSNPNRASFDQNELKTMVYEAHKLGKLTAAHCRSTEGVINALDTGVDMILHSMFYEPDGSYKFRPDLAERMAKRAVPVNPTIHVQRAWIWHLEKKRDENGLTFQEEQRLRRFSSESRMRIETCQRLKEAGVKLVAGSDNWGIYPVGEFYNEIEAIVTAGLSNMEAIVSATKDSAKAIGVGDIVGTLEPGKEADILVVDGNPAEDIKALAAVKGVFKSGELVT